MTPQDALSALLDALGFKQMAEDVKTETDPQRLVKYCNVILRTSPEDKRRQLRQSFRALGLISW